MSKVKRYDVGDTPDGGIDVQQFQDGYWVKHEDYAELKAQRDALAAENAAMLADYRDIPEMRRIGAPLTPATDAYLNAVRAEGVEMLAKRMEENGYQSTSNGARVFAAQLRSGAPKGDSE